MIKIQLIILSRLLKTYNKYTFKSNSNEEQDSIVLYWVFLVPHIIKKKHYIFTSDIFKLLTDRQQNKKNSIRLERYRLGLIEFFSFCCLSVSNFKISLVNIYIFTL